MHLRISRKPCHIAFRTVFLAPCGVRSFCINQLMSLGLSVCCLGDERTQERGACTMAHGHPIDIIMSSRDCWATPPVVAGTYIPGKPNFRLGSDSFSLPARARFLTTKVLFNETRASVTSCGLLVAWRAFWRPARRSSGSGVDCRTQRLGTFCQAR